MKYFLLCTFEDGTVTQSRADAKTPTQAIFSLLQEDVQWYVNEVTKHHGALLKVEVEQAEEGQTA